MGLFDFFKKNINKNIDITLFNTMEPIPSIKSFKDESLISKIKEYEEYYLSILSQKRRVVSKTISCDYTLNKKEMYRDLIYNCIGNNTISFDYKKLNKLELKIIEIKLKLYLNKLVNIKNEITERLVALNEISKQITTIFKINPLNIPTLHSEINNLRITLATINAQIKVIKNEIESCLTHIIISDEETDNTIERRKEEVIDYAKAFININELFSIEELESKEEEKQIEIITLLEIKLEEYVYTHKDEIKDLNEEINSINQYVNSNYEDARKNKKKLLEKLRLLEKKYLVFDKYGRNLVSDDDFYHLYSTKFNVLTSDIFENDDNKDKNSLIIYFSNTKEKEVYENIIFEKKQTILLNKNKVIQKLFGNKSGQLLKLLTKYYKEKSPYTKFFSNDKYCWFNLEALELLLALDSVKNLKRLLHKKVDIST